MSKVCAICANKNHDQIDKLIVQKTPYRTIAEKFKIKAKDPIQAIKNHVRYGHISKKIQDAQESEEVRSGLELQACVQEVYSLCLDAAKDARQKDLRAFGGCIGPAVKVLEILNKGAPEEDSGPGIDRAIQRMKDDRDARRANL